MYFWVALVVVSLLVFLMKKSMENRDKRLDMPGPRGLPIFGNLFDLDTQTPYVKLQEWAKQYGDIFKIKLLNEEVVVLSSYETIHEALVNKANDFAGRPSRWRLEYIVPGKNRDIVFQDFTRDFRQIKRLTQHCLKPFSDGRDEVDSLSQPHIQQCIDDFISHQGQPFDPREAIHKCVVNIMMAIIVGDEVARVNDLYCLIEQTHSAMEACGQGQGMELDVFPWLRFFGNKTFKILHNFKTITPVLFNTWIHLMKDKMGKGDLNHTLLEGLIMQEEEGHLDREELHGVIFNAVAASINTSISALSSMILFLVNNPQVYKKMTKEIGQVIGKERAPSIDDAEQMPYVYATILETLRYGSTTTLSVPHKTTCNTFLGKYYIPKDTQVWTNLWAMHYDERHFPEPKHFKPERFLDEQGNLLPPTKIHSFLPFSAGRRACPGEALAKARLFLFVTSLLQQVDILPADKHNIPDPDPTKFSFAITNQPTAFEIVALARSDKTD